MKENVPEGGKVRIEDVQGFVRTAPGPVQPDPSGSKGGKSKHREQPSPYSNPQTEAFCRMLKVYNFVNPGASEGVGMGS